MKKQIPNMLTLGNVFCGCVGIIFCLKGEPWMVFWMMVAAAVLDFFDGFIARLLKVSGPLGKELDSLADGVTFGALPGIMMYKLMLEGQPQHDLLPYIGLLIAVFSAYRLAKFNISEDQSDNFVGLPTPINALFVASLTLIDHPLIENNYLLIGISVFNSWLLVSNFKLIALKFKGFGLKENMAKYLLIVAAIILVFTLKIAAIPFILLAYLIISFLHFKLNVL